jgi:hypothetical protein
MVGRFGVANLWRTRIRVPRSHSCERLFFSSERVLTRVFLWAEAIQWNETSAEMRHY